MEEYFREMIPLEQYIVRCNGILHESDRKTLTLLYQPLIGHRAYNLYMTLWSELPFSESWGEEHNHYGLIDIMQMSLKEIYEERLRLEAIGLLRTYAKEGDTRSYIYEIQPPLAPDKFFNDGMLNVFLYHRVDQQTFSRLKKMFTTNKVNTSQYTNISRSFNEVFKSVALDKKVARMNEEMKQELSLPTSLTYVGGEAQNTLLGEHSFDFELFFAGMSEQLVPKKSITNKVKEVIKKLSFLYGISPLEMQKVVIRVIDEGGQINVEQLKKAAHNWYTLERGMVVPQLISRITSHQKLQTTEFTKEQQLIQSFETMSPRELIMDIAGGAEPSDNELKVIEDIMFKQKLPANVMNVLVYCTMLQTSMQLPKPYMEKIASDWARNKIKTVQEAMNYAKGRVKKQTIATGEVKKQTRTKRTSQISSEEPKAIPSWLKEGE